MMDLKVNAKSNDNIEHHLIEDTAITIGLAVDKALGNRSGITRFSYASVPMDESLAEASIDLVKRPFSKLTLLIKRNKIEDISKEDFWKDKEKANRLLKELKKLRQSTEPFIKISSELDEIKELLAITEEKDTPSLSHLKENLQNLKKEIDNLPNRIEQLLL